MSRDFVPFELERMQSIWEHEIEYNLTESGPHPMSIRDLVQEPDLIEELLTMELGYPQTNGLPELRQNIAALYPGATQDNVLVTTGCAQANFVTLLTLLEPGDEIAIMLPNYMQIWGIAQNFGYKPKAFWLKEELDWAPDLAELEDAVTSKTKLIAICNPNNPTGYILTSAEMDAVVATAARVGAWLLSDEVYAGAERLTDDVTPSFWGRYDKVLAMGSLSKAYGLQGLRIGWVVAPSETTEQIWSWQDYVTISTTLLANKLAAYALSARVRPRIIERTRALVRNGYRNFERWCEKQGDLFTYIPPQAAAIAWVRYRPEINSTELVHRLLKEQAFVVPGDLFGMDHFLRVSTGLPLEYLNEGLGRLAQVLEELD